MELTSSPLFECHWKVPRYIVDEIRDIKQSGISECIDKEENKRTVGALYYYEKIQTALSLAKAKMLNLPTPCFDPSKKSFIALAAFLVGILATSLVDRTTPTECTRIRSIAVSFSYNTASMMTHTLGARVSSSTLKISCLK